MKKKYLTMIILLGFSCLLMSCAGLEFIPKGSQSLGVYKGSFTGDMWDGTLLIHLYQTPEGNKLFKANFAGPDDPTRVTNFFVHGKITANLLEGEVQGKSSGTLTGQLSTDGNRLTGSFNVTEPDQNKGTWQAQKK
jgi:hypothetical protein